MPKEGGDIVRSIRRRLSGGSVLRRGPHAPDHGYLRGCTIHFTRDYLHVAGSRRALHGRLGERYRRHVRHSGIFPPFPFHAGKYAAGRCGGTVHRACGESGVLRLSHNGRGNHVHTGAADPDRNGHRTGGTGPRGDAFRRETGGFGVCRRQCLGDAMAGLLAFQEKQEGFSRP